MAQKTDAELTTDANVIKNETDAGENTANRVGSHMVDNIDSKINNDKIIDEDDMSSDSATHVPTQQSVKAYVDNGIIAANTFAIVDISGGATLDNTAFGKLHLCTGTSSNYTLTLPTAVGNKDRSIAFKGSSALTVTVTIDGNGGETLDGDDSRQFTGGGIFVLLSDGANWHIVNEVGSWIPYTPVWTGFSVDPTVTSAKFFREGKICTVKIRCNTNGTSNATTTTVTVPFNASTDLQFGLIFSLANNNAVSTTPGSIVTRSNSNIIDLYINLQSAAWSASNGKRASFTLTYELV